MKIERLKDFEDDYLIDELGNIVTIPSPNNVNPNQYERYYVVKGRVDKNGYVRIALTKNGKAKEYLKHRLVASQFIPNPENLPQVNHIDGNKTNNRVDNLEWVSAKQNKRHAYDNNISGTAVKCLEVLERINAKTRYVKVIIENDYERLEFESAKDAAAYIDTRIDNVTRAIRHNIRCLGYKCYGEKAQSANEES